MTITKDYRVFGMPMQLRSSRRMLVVATYVLLALCCAASIAVAAHNSLTYYFALYPAVLVAMFIFGGQGSKGLLKGFANKPPPNGIIQIEAERLSFMTPRQRAETEAAIWKNDERELARRDRAHYKAYQVIGLAPVITLLVAAWALFPKEHAISAQTWLPLIFGLSEVGCVLMMTLPAAIILWTEPDMEVDEESLATEATR